MPDGERIKEGDESWYRYLGILDYEKVKESKMRRTFRENIWGEPNYSYKTHSMVGIRYCNKYMSYFINEMWWMLYERDKKKNLDRKTRKVMTMNKKLKLIRDADRLHVSTTGGEKRLIPIKIKSEKSILWWYIRHCIYPLIVAVRNNNTVHNKNLT